MLAWIHIAPQPSGTSGRPVRVVAGVAGIAILLIVCVAVSVSGWLAALVILYLVGLAVVLRLLVGQQS
jgi:hypothetical protein